MALIVTIGERKYLVGLPKNQYTYPVYLLVSRCASQRTVIFLYAPKKPLFVAKLLNLRRIIKESVAG